MKHVFILTYEGIQELNSWFDASIFGDGYKFHIIDNGNQEIPDRLKQYITWVCKENIFCAGGWNLSCLIGFDKFRQEKIIITQDDVYFTKQTIDKCLEGSSSSVICGARNDMFLFSFFAIHVDTFRNTGSFDENCLLATCEDNDYIYRMNQLGGSIVSANIHLPNKNLSSLKVSFKYGNQEYIEQKKHNILPKFRKEYWTFFNQGPYSNFMSTIEYFRYLK